MAGKAVPVLYTELHGILPWGDIKRNGNRNSLAISFTKITKHCVVVCNILYIYMTMCFRASSEGA